MAKVKVVILLLVCVSAAVCQNNGDVRLVGRQSSDGTGVVEVYVNGAWGTVQPTDYDGVGQAVCRQLGYDDVGTANTFEIMRYTCDCDETNSSIPTVLRHGQCGGKSLFTSDAHTHILQCSYTNGVFYLDHLNDLVVDCSPVPIGTAAYDSQVRLVQSDTGYKSSGYVEVYLNLTWGPVCHMTRAAANTTCRQLGYSYATSNTDKSGYSASRPNKLSQFTCSSSGTCLNQCFNYPSKVATCPLHSVVSCTFDTSSIYDGAYGNSSTCSASNLFPVVAVAVGVVVAFIVVVFIIFAISCALCFCLPGCALAAAARGPRQKVVYQSI